MKTSMVLVVAAVFLAVAMFGPILVAGQGAGSCPVNGECAKECGMAKYQRDPNAYPSLNMNRYKFIRAYYSVLRFLADCYFALVNAIFSLLNHFKPIEHVRWANDSKLLFLSGKQAAKKIRDGMITSRQLVSAYIARIKAVNPLVNGMHFDNFNAALALADQFDANLTAMNAYNRQQLAQTQPLGGVPFTSKMNIHNKGFNISACNAILMNSTGPSTEDAPVVARMKAAGAILLGITTMPNLGLSIAGDDSGCGQINNPHDARRSSGGSSSGEGVLIGAAASPFGIGNDIGGSLRVPAHHNGVFGLKPTTFPNHTVPFAGVVPDFAAYPPARAMLTNGPMARYADDLPTLLSVLSGKSLNAYNINVNFRRNFRLFYMEDMDILIAEGLHSEQRDSVRKVKNYFEQEYNMTVQKVNFPLMNRLWELWGVKGISDGLVSISDMPALFKEVHYGPSMNTFLALELAILKDFVFPKDDKETTFVTKKLAKLRAQVNDLLGQDGLLLLPAWPTTTPFHNIEPFTPFNLGHVLLLNQLGNPAIAVPTGKSPITGMPLGVQLAAAPFNEALLIAAARELEKAFGGWVQPGGGPSQ